MAQLLTCPGPTKPFPGFSTEAFSLLRGLKRNRGAEWLKAHYGDYEKLIRTPLLDLVCSVSRECARFAPDYATLPAKAVFRIYDDTRSSSNKAAYHTHPAAIWVHKSVERMRGACFYFHFTEKEAVVLGGVYSAEPDELLAYRRLLHEKYEEFEGILRCEKLQATMGELQGDKLSRTPKGFCPNHPAQDLLRRKQWYLVSMLDVNLLTTCRLMPTLVSHFEAMAPFVEFLNRPFALKGKLKKLSFAPSAGPESCH